MKGIVPIYGEAEIRMRRGTHASGSGTVSESWED